MNPKSQQKKKSKDPVFSLVSLIKERKIRSFEEACDALNVAPKRLHELIAKAKERKFAIDLAGDTLGIKPTMPSDVVTEVKVAKAGSLTSFATISDPHFGSKYHLRAQLEDFVGEAYEQGVRNILLPGDNLDGCYRHGKWELTHHGFQNQVNEFREGLPRFPGLKYWGITGNHDQTFEAESGMVVHEAINEHFRANNRRDLTMLGARGAYLRLVGPEGGRGVFIELWHPIKGPAYALTYGLQKHVEKYAPGQKPDFLFTGHWHQGVYVPIRGVHCYSCGTFQGGASSYGKSLGGAPTIGSWVVDFATTLEGTVRRVRSEFKQYFEKEHHRTVELG